MRLARRRWTILLLLAAVGLLLGGVYWFRAGDVPRGQAALVSIGTAEVEELRAEFNRNADRHRLILLLSPT